MRDLRGYINYPTSGAFPWPGSLDKIEPIIKSMRGHIGNVTYWVEDVQFNDEIVKLVIWQDNE